jgi:hypothetical protein
MYKQKIAEIAGEILQDWQEPSEYKKQEPTNWDGPSGDIWSEEKKKFVNPDKTDECDCEALYETDHHPSKYLRPTDISW